MTDRLERLRDRAHNQMLIIMRFAETINDTTSVEDIETRLEGLEAKYTTFNDLEVQLFENTTYVSITEEVDEIYYKARALLIKASSKYTKRENNTTHDLNATLEHFIDQQKTFYEGVNMSQHVRLPKINIEQFSGDYKHWASFRDLFNTTIHGNQNVSNVHKLQILKGLLSGEAASLIRHISITENNYTEAWDKLCNRYNKMNPIVTSLLHTFMEQKTCMQANGKELRHLTETSDEIIRGLRALGPSAETRDPWIIHVLLNKLDNETKQLWANDSVGKDFPKFETLLDFLNKRCDALEICNATTQKYSMKSSAKSFVSTNPKFTFECVVCKQAHPLFKCPVFKNQNVPAREQIVKQNNLCYNCLKGGHLTEKCFSKSFCLICNKRHHSLLHSTQSELQPVYNQRPTSQHIPVDKASIITSRSDSSQAASIIKPNENIELNQPTNNQIKDQMSLHTLESSSTTVLPTAVVCIESRTGKLQQFRALLDSGSQTSFITESSAQCLGLKRSQASISIFGLASTSAGQTKEKINLNIYSRLDQKCKLNTTAHIIGNITNLLPTRTIPFQNQIEGVQLADPQFFKPSKIDVLLGADVFFEILNPERQIIKGFPTLQSTKLGWLVAGTYNEKELNKTDKYTTFDPDIQPINDGIQKPLTKFREVEVVGPQNFLNTSVNPCEKYYEETTTRNAEGRFMAKLQFKQPRPQLGRSFEAARQHQLTMVQKLIKKPKYYDAYKSFIHEYIDLEHMTHIPCITEITTQDDTIQNMIGRFSSWVKILMVNILKFERPSQQTKLKKSQNKLTTSTEMNNAETVITRNIQQTAFKNELAILNKNALLPRTHQLSSLDPFLDSNGLLRIGERQHKSALSYSAKHPVLLPKTYTICIRIIDNIHVKYIHTVNSLTLSSLRNKYWMIDSLCTRNRIISSCIVYARYRCTRTKLNMVNLKRIIARRRIHNQSWCNNGSNFISVNRKLELKHQVNTAVNNVLIFKFSLQKSITFYFYQPYTLHIGGLCEVFVKHFQYHLSWITNTKLTFQEVTTLVVQIEWSLNSKLLYKIDDGSNSLEVFTSAHFVVGEPLTTITKPKLDDIPVIKLSQRQINHLRLQIFWDRWHRDYLTALQQKYKRKKLQCQFEVNDAALIREDNLYPSQWICGRVTAVHPGSDGIIRVVTLKTSKSEIKRPVNKLIKLLIK